MSKSIFKEEQRSRNWEVPVLLLFFMVALTVKLVFQHWLNPVPDPMPFSTYVILILPLGFGLWYVLSLRLSLKVTNKGISLKYSPLFSKKHKIKWEEMEECRFIEMPAGAQWSGWNISFHQKVFSLCGKTGIHVKTKTGEDILIGARDYEAFKNAVSRVLQ